jgi:hypothetical protein
VQAFTEVLSNNETWSADMTETYKLLDIDPTTVQGLEDYLKVGVPRVGEEVKCE